MASLISQVAGNIRKRKGDEEADPTAEMFGPPTPEGATEAVSAPGAPVEKPEEKPLNSRLAMAILALAPAIAGYAAGGDTGGAIGGAAGVQGVKDVLAGEEKTKSLAREKEKEAKEDKYKAETLAIQKQAGETDAQYKSRMAKVAEREAGVKEAEVAAKNPANLNVQQRLSKLSGEQRKLLDLQIMGTKAMQGMKDAYAKGDWTFSMKGDNNYTRWARSAAEAFGRLQSGGAINKEEEKRFMAMLPGSMDSNEIQLAKLAQAEDEFNSRLTNSGFTAQDFGIVPVDMAAVAKKSGQNDIFNLLVPNAHAGTETGPSREEMIAAIRAKQEKQAVRTRDAR